MNAMLPLALSIGVITYLLWRSVRQDLTSSLDNETLTLWYLRLEERDLMRLSTFSKTACFQSLTMSMGKPFLLHHFEIRLSSPVTICSLALLSGFKGFGSLYLGPLIQQKHACKTELTGRNGTGIFLFTLIVLFLRAFHAVCDYTKVQLFLWVSM